MSDYAARAELLRDVTKELANAREELMAAQDRVTRLQMTVDGLSGLMLMDGARALAERSVLPPN